MRKTLFALLATALLCSMFALASLRAEIIWFGQSGQVTITQPKGWQIESKEDAFGPGNHAVTLIANTSRKPGCSMAIVAGERQPAFTEAGFLAFVEDRYANGAGQFVEKTPSFRKLDINNGFGYYCVASYAAGAGKAPAEGTSKICGSVLIYRKDSPLIDASLFVDDPNDPALDLMVKAICEMKVSFPPLPENLVQFDKENSIKLDIPPNWGTMRQEGSPLPNIGRSFDLKLTPPSGIKASLTVTTGKTETGRPLTKQQFDYMAKRLADGMIPESVEKKVAYKEIQIRGGHGIYCTFTDASLVNKTAGPNQYKYVGLFLASYDNGYLTFGTALTDDPNGADYQVMLKTFSSIEPSFGITTPPVQVKTTKQGTLISSAASPQKLLLPSKTLKTKSDRYGGGMDDPGYFYLEDTKLKILISGWLEPVAKFQYVNAREMWSSENADRARSKAPMPKNEEYQKIGDWDVYLYDLQTPPQFKNTTSGHLRANYLNNQTWIDVHLSLTQPMPSDILRNMLIMYFKTLTITDDTSGK